MAERKVADMPLRDVFTEAERLARELVDHLDQGFLPKVRALRELVTVSEQGVGPSDVEDVTVRNHAAQLLDRANYASNMYVRLDECLESIGRKVRRITSGE